MTIWLIGLVTGVFRLWTRSAVLADNSPGQVSSDAELVDNSPGQVSSDAELVDKSPGLVSSDKPGSRWTGKQKQIQWSAFVSIQ